jgi:hypothetical protein
MLSWKIMQATQAACQSVCMAEEAALHYGEPYTRLDRWIVWWRGFFAGWDNDSGSLEIIRLRDRFARLFKRRAGRPTSSR